MDIEKQFFESIFRFKNISTSFPVKLDSWHDETNINLTEFMLMKYVSDNYSESGENISISDIQNSLFITKAAVSQMYGTLEKKGYLNRAVNPNNRRQLMITLTTEGYEALRIVENKMKLIMSKIISNMGEDDFNQFIASINKFADVIEVLEADVIDALKDNTHQ